MAESADVSLNTEEIVRRIFDDEKYEEGAEITRLALAAAPEVHQPFLMYLKLFADGYRTWQISYRYLEIRNYFALASATLRQRDPASVGSTAENQLADALQAMSRMLASYTWCENSFINNDPVQLARHAADAVRHGRQGIACLEGLEFPQDAFLATLAISVGEYLHKNVLLHEGLRICAENYSPTFLRGVSSPEQMARLAEYAPGLAELRKRSFELGSELSAHFQVVKRHLAAAAAAPGAHKTLLVRRGFVTMSLTSIAPSALAGDSERSAGFRVWFEARLKTVLGQRGLVPEAFKVGRLHDIFETSLGAERVAELTFDVVPAPGIDLPERWQHYPPDTLFAVKLFGRSDSSTQPATPPVRCLAASDGAGAVEYPFSVRVTLSALGACTIECQHEIKDDAPLAVHEIRALQSLICPHAGQVELLLPDGLRPRQDDRCQLIEQLEFLCDFETHDKLVPCLQELGRDLSGIAASALKARDDRTAHHVNRHFADRGHLPGSGRYCYVQRLLADLLTEVLRAAHDVTGKEFVEPSLDTAWHVGLSATDIGVGDEPALSADDSALSDHPDFKGLLVEQREARASLDDWRLTPAIALDKPGFNLAGIRSHTSDILVTSEYRAFMYFPDDPKFLIDQYAMTVRVMNQLRIKLRNQEDQARRLAEDIRKRLEPRDGSIKELEELRSSIERQVLEVNDLQSLVSKTGLSRYKDHGELLVAIGGALNLERSLDLLGQRVTGLWQLHTRVLEFMADKDRERQDAVEKKRSLKIFVLTFLVTAGAVKDIYEVATGMGWRLVIWAAVLLAVIVFVLMPELRRPADRGEQQA